MNDDGPQTTTNASTDPEARRHVTLLGLAGCTSAGEVPSDGGVETDGPPAADVGHTEVDAHHDEDEHSGDEPADEDEGHAHDEGTLEAPSPGAEMSLQTEGSGHHFAPHVVWIGPGGTVTWHLESGSHDVVAYHPDNDRPRRMPEDATPWQSELLGEEGEDFEHTFEREGVYDYYCTPHEAVGMVGTVIVGEPDAHDQPALEEPQESLPDGARSELADLGVVVNEALGNTH